jgi:cytochrome c-type biogenesis protein CcmH
VPSAQDSTVTKHSSRRSALVLAIFIPLAAVFGYVQLGNLKGLEAKPNQAHMQAQELDAMLARLVERLKANPGDTKGWVMLARSYKSLGRFAEAAEAFSHGGALVEGDATLLADYAETLAQANGGDFTDKADALLARALKLDPSEPQALFLAGASASDRRDFVAAIDYWGRLLPQLEAGSEEANSLSAAIDKAREILGPAGAANNKSTKKKDVASDAAQAISGEVVLSGKLASKAQPEDTLYVFARPAEGSRMPLAVLRARVADLPLKFSLDDRSSLPGGQKLSAAKDVVLEARVTKGGIAQSISGDLFGTLKGIKPGSKNQRLIIDQVQP